MTRADATDGILYPPTVPFPAKSPTLSGHYLSRLMT